MNRNHVVAGRLAPDRVSAMVWDPTSRGFMANPKATLAKRQRETDLKDRAKAKDDRRAQKRTEVRPDKGPQIAWDEAVHAVTSDEDLPSLRTANQDGLVEGADAQLAA